jgi:hypothetical protein
VAGAAGAPRAAAGQGRPDARSARDGKPARQDKPGRDGKPGRLVAASRAQGRLEAGQGRQRPRRSQARYDGPELPEEITGKRARPLGERPAEGAAGEAGARVARHLAAAGMLIDEDPETAYQHTLAARARAARLAVVREATG